MTHKPDNIGFRVTGRRRAVVWGTIVLLAFLAPAGQKFLEGEEFVPLDTAAYLTTAREVHQRGGPVGLLLGCFTGSYREANRMPLYIGILSLLPSETIRVLPYAKLVTLAIGAAALLTIFACARRLFGLPAAVVACAALAINSHYLLYSTVVASEALLALWVMLTWFFLARYLQGRGRFMWVGLGIALAYLSKGSGLFLAPLALAVAVWKERARLWRSREVWAGVAVFLVVALPLMVRNARVYGSPFYNENTSVMWQDSWEERYSPDREVSRPTFGTYRARHTARDAAARIARGAWQQGVYSVVALGETALFHEILGWKVWPFGLLALGLGFLPLLRRSDRAPARLGWAIFLGFNLFFAWYPVKDVRFIVPVVPVLTILAGRGAHIAVRGAARAWRPLRRVRPWFVTRGVASAVLVANAALAPRLAPVRKALTPPPGYFELFRWLRDHATESSVIMMGPSHEYDYFWTDEVRGRRIAVPWADSIRALQRVVGNEGVDYVVVDRSTLRQRESTFAGWISPEGDAVRVERVPAGWRPVFTAGGRSPSVVVFEVVASANGT